MMSVDNNPQITVFTTTYNREKTLDRLYESLCEQTSKNFIWLIIDDGSTDNTRRLVQDWQNEQKIIINYHYKNNGGMHTGHNLAYEKIETELNVCIDSDDYMPNNSVELILSKWDSINKKENLAGIIGLDAFNDGAIVGSKIPENLTRGTLLDLYELHNVKGDKKIILRTDIVRKYPKYPEYDNERLVPLGSLYTMIGQDYDCIYSNEVYCIVEYQIEGSSNTIFKQYKQSPRGFAYAKKISIRKSKSTKQKVKDYIHLVSSSIFAKDFFLAFKDVNLFYSLLAYPFGIVFNLYVRYKIRTI